MQMYFYYLWCPEMDDIVIRECESECNEIVVTNITGTGLSSECQEGEKYRRTTTQNNAQILIQVHE